MEKVPYTDNTEKIRIQLEKLGYSPLKFFQGGKFIKPIISIRGNSKEQWKVYDYSTFDDVNKYDLELFYLTEKEFLQELIVKGKANTNKNQKELMNILDDDYDLNKQFHEISKEIIYSFATANYNETLTFDEWLNKYYN